MSFEFTLIMLVLITNADQTSIWLITWDLWRGTKYLGELKEDTAQGTFAAIFAGRHDTLWDNAWRGTAGNVVRDGTTFVGTLEDNHVV